MSFKLNRPAIPYEDLDFFDRDNIKKAGDRSAQYGRYLEVNKFWDCFDPQGVTAGEHRQMTDKQRAESHRRVLDRNKMFEAVGSEPLIEMPSPLSWSTGFDEIDKFYEDSALVSPMAATRPNGEGGGDEMDIDRPGALHIGGSSIHADHDNDNSSMEEFIHADPDAVELVVPPTPNGAVSSNPGSLYGSSSSGRPYAAQGESTRANVTREQEHLLSLSQPLGPNVPSTTGRAEEASYAFTTSPVPPSSPSGSHVQSTTMPFQPHTVAGANAIARNNGGNEDLDAAFMNQMTDNMWTSPRQSSSPTIYGAPPLPPFPYGGPIQAGISGIFAYTPAQMTYSAMSNRGDASTLNLAVQQVPQPAAQLLATLKPKSEARSDPERNQGMRLSGGDQAQVGSEKGMDKGKKRKSLDPKAKEPPKKSRLSEVPKLSNEELLDTFEWKPREYWEKMTHPQIKDEVNTVSDMRRYFSAVPKVRFIDHLMSWQDKMKVLKEEKEAETAAENGKTYATSVDSEPGVGAEEDEPADEDMGVEENEHAADATDSDVARSSAGPSQPFVQSSPNIKSPFIAQSGEAFRSSPLTSKLQHVAIESRRARERAESMALSDAASTVGGHESTRGKSEAHSVDSNRRSSRNKGKVAAGVDESARGREMSETAASVTSIRSRKKSEAPTIGSRRSSRLSGAELEAELEDE